MIRSTKEMVLKQILIKHIPEELYGKMSKEFLENKKVDLSTQKTMK